MTNQETKQLTEEELLQDTARNLLAGCHKLSAMLLKMTDQDLTNPNIMRSFNLMSLNLGRFRRLYKDITKEQAPISMEEALLKKQAAEQVASHKTQQNQSKHWNTNWKKNQQQQMPKNLQTKTHQPESNSEAITQLYAKLDASLKKYSVDELQGMQKKLLESISGQNG